MLLFAVGPAMASEAAGESVVLRWKWTANQEWLAEFTQTAVTDSTFGAKTLRLAVTSRWTQRWRVDSVDAQGAASITQSFTRIAVDIDMGMGNTLGFDSQRPIAGAGEPRRLADALQPLIGPTWKLVVSPRGEIMQIAPSAELSAASEQLQKNSVLQPLFGADGVVGPIRQAFVLLPEASVAPGGGWRATLPFKAAFGAGEIATDYKFEGLRSDGGIPMAAIASTSRVEAKTGAGEVAKGRELKDQKVAGMFLFDSQNGTLVDARQSQMLRTESRVRDIPLAVQLASDWTFTLRKESDAAPTPAKPESP